MKRVGMTKKWERMMADSKPQVRIYRVFAKGTLNLDVLYNLESDEHPVLEWAKTYGYYTSYQAARERAEEVARERWDKHDVNGNWVSRSCLRSGMDEICIAEHVLDECLKEIDVSDVTWEPTGTSGGKEPDHYMFDGKVYEYPKNKEKKMNGAEQHKELILSMMLNTIKYREARIPALEKAIERFGEATDDESMKDAAGLRLTLKKNKQWLAELQDATRWLLQEEWLSIPADNSVKAELIGMLQT